MRKVSGLFGKLEVVKTKVIEKVSGVKNGLLLVGSGITAISLLFVIASVFVDALGMYIGLLIGFTVITELMQLVNDNKAVK